MLAVFVSFRPSSCIRDEIFSTIIRNGLKSVAWNMACIAVDFKNNFKKLNVSLI